MLTLRDRKAGLLTGKQKCHCRTWLPKPTCRAPDARRMFVGQSGGKAQGGGMPQREQKAVLAAFRKGEFNTLVATCIGEEGLDIPQARTPKGFFLWLVNLCVPDLLPHASWHATAAAWCVAKCVGWQVSRDGGVFGY